MSEKPEEKETPASIVAKLAREGAMKDTEKAKKKLEKQQKKAVELKEEQVGHELAQGVRPPSEELEPKEPTRDEKIEARVTELCDINTRRGLEVIARDVGFEPTRTEFPDKISLAKAIAEKEIPEEAPAEEEAETA